MAADLRPELSSACQVVDESFALPRITESGYADELLSQCLQRGISLVVPTIDTELPVLAANRERFQQHGITIVVSDENFVAQANNKHLTSQFLNAVGIATPAQLIAEPQSYPVFVKPTFGSSSQDLHLVTGRENFRAEFLDASRYIVQEYVDPAEFQEITIDLYFDRNSNLQCLVPRLRIETRAGEVSKGVTFKDDLYNQLVPLLRHWPGARGCITLQVFANHDRSKIFGIEVNPRFGGGYPLSHAAGANFPLWLIQEYPLGEQISFFDSWEANLLMLRYDDEVLVHDYRPQ